LVRQPHLLFEPSESSFARCVLRQRVLKCRDSFAGATGTGRSVVDIASGCGFSGVLSRLRPQVRRGAVGQIVLLEGLGAG
jgi:hypothetical protein